MERDVLSDAAVAAVLRENFVPVAVRRAGPASAEPWSAFGLPDGGSPAFALIGADGKELDRHAVVASKEDFLWTLGVWKSGRTIDALRTAVREHPEDAELRFVLGKRLLGRQEKGALEELRRAVALDRGEAHAWSVEARWLVLAERRDEGRYDDLVAFTRDHPESQFAIEAHSTVARWAAAQGDDAQALRSYEFLHARDRLGWRAEEYARLLAFHGHDAELALQLVDSLLLERTDDASLHDVRAEALSRLHRFDEAVAAAQRALEIARERGDEAARREYQRAVHELRKQRDASRQGK